MACCTDAWEAPWCEKLVLMSGIACEAPWCEKLVVMFGIACEEEGITSIGTVDVADGVIPNWDEWQGPDWANLGKVSCTDESFPSAFGISGRSPMTVFGRCLREGSTWTCSTSPWLCQTMQSATLVLKAGAEAILDLRILVTDGTGFSWMEAILGLMKFIVFWSETGSVSTVPVFMFVLIILFGWECRWVSW